MEHIPYPTYRSFLGFTLGALLLHVFILLTLDRIMLLDEPKPSPKVAVKIVTQPKKAAEITTPDLPPPPRPKRRQSQRERMPTPKPVLGLSQESFRKDEAPGISAPAGNTINTSDQGIRLSPDEIAKLDKDLSQDAELISDSFARPQYTPEAEDAGLEGRFVVEVYVDRDGRVNDVELPRKIGFGMDDRVLASALNARFRPRRDAKGNPLEGWTEIKVRLTLD